jgi:hypothetical protein
LVPYLASQADNGVDPAPTPVAEPPAEAGAPPRDPLPGQPGPVEDADAAIDPASARDSEPPGTRAG